MFLSHLLWIPAAATVGFGASFVFGDILTLAVDLYYLIYFAIVLGFLAFYARRTELDVRSWASRRLLWGIVLGVLGGFVLMRGVLARPPTARLSGAELWWAVVWRGLVYGGVDGSLLLAFPWLVAWRTFEADRRRFGAKLGTAVVAWAGILLVTTAYHLGYRDFRSRKILQPNLGSTIGSVPTLVTANPVASTLSHVFLHVTAVLHAPETELFLPPHRDGGAALRSPSPSRSRDPNLTGIGSADPRMLRAGRDRDIEDE